MNRHLRIFSFILALIIAFPIFAEPGALLPLFAEETTVQEAEPPETADENLPDFVEPEYHSEFTMPEELRAVTITPELILPPERKSRRKAFPQS